MTEKCICNICLDNPTQINIPCENCKHLEWYICDSCIIKMQTYEDISKKCPLCRRESKQLIELYDIINPMDKIEITIENEDIEHIENTEHTEYIDNTNYCYKYIFLNGFFGLLSIFTYIIMRYTCVLVLNGNKCQVCEHLAISTSSSFLIFLYSHIFKCLKQKISFVLEHICLFVFCFSIFTLIFINVTCNINDTYGLFSSIFIMCYFFSCCIIYKR